jgi:hypothetical protein
VLTCRGGESISLQGVGSDISGIEEMGFPLLWRYAPHLYEERRQGGIGSASDRTFGQDVHDLSGVRIVSDRNDCLVARLESESGVFNVQGIFLVLSGA